MEFNDAIREGDGLRILHCWKYFLLHFKEANRKNYAIEAFNLLAQYHVVLSPRMAMQLLWNRTINTHGRPGKNIPCDSFRTSEQADTWGRISLIVPYIELEKASVTLLRS